MTTYAESVGRAPFDWQTGIPDVPKGRMRRFWCLVKNEHSDAMVLLCYGNAFVMPLSDSCDDVPKNAVPLGDDGDYEWTGWWQESCDQCDTYWDFHGTVKAWIRLPGVKTATNELARIEARSAELVAEMGK